MMKKAVYILALLLLCLPLCAQKRGDHVIGFYNVENLFDTVHDEDKNDYDYTPDGNYAWTQDKYHKKLDNIARVIKAMKKENRRWHAVLGLAEVENDAVLRDLVERKDIAPAGFKYVHYESPDRRGIDVAMLYRPDEFKLLDSGKIPFSTVGTEVPLTISKEEQEAFRTRDVLMVRGTIDGEMFAFYVAHLPSRIGGKGGDLRGVGADIIWRHAMAMQKKYPGIKIVVMGDMNDDPSDESMTRWLHGCSSIAATGEQDFFSPMAKVHADGTGSLEYRGGWNLFDIIMVNSALAAAPSGSLHILPVDSKGHYGRVFSKAFMVQQSGQYKGTPFRTFSHGAFIGGYSDHYPTYILIGKK